ncbi:alpha-glucoside transport ATP-binding protein AglK [Limimaricola cinnabarinus LL-001]|uniref:Alpha-glucoside transport ATP-binding protein AglK n=2 Tax=Limimaricola cinnabarinus TaxID=1125964 RepID=U2Z4S7_9RHOB|nr:alpha-glucoside transport ATP-binding protein AglK [Limimaricola cinnabarinus LL-001]
MGKVVKLGARPEDLIETTDAGGAHIFEGRVDFTESLGEVTILYFEKVNGADPVIAKLPGIHSDLRGRNVRLSAAPEKVQVFHEGRSLYYR